MKNSIFKLLFKLFLLTIGVLIISWIIWARLLRERLPRDIPFNLSEIGLYILLVLCCIYLYIVIKLLKPSVPQPIFEDIRNYIFLPLTTLDETIKNNKYIKLIHLSFIRMLINKLNIYNNNKVVKLSIFVFFRIIPRIILVITLCIDTFYFSQLFYLYKIIWIGIFPLLHRYIKYSLKYAQEKYTKELEYSYNSININKYEFEPDDHDYYDEYNDFEESYGKYIIIGTIDVNIRDYIELETENQYNNKELDYDAGPVAHEHIFDIYCKTYNIPDNLGLTNNDYIIIDKEFLDLMPIIININVFIKEYTLSTEKKYLTYIQVGIYTVYFICWSYLSYVSYNTVESTPILHHMINCIDFIEPFSQIIL